MRIGWIFALVAASLLVPMVGCTPKPDKQSAVNHYVRGWLLAEDGDLDAALAELAEATRTDPTLSVAYAVSGDIYRKKGDWQQARHSYERACDTNPYAFDPHYHLALTYQTLAKAAKTVERIQEYLRLSIDTYQIAVAIEPEDFDTNLNISACYFRLGKFELAEQYCQAATEAKPDDPRPHANLAIIYDRQERLYEAIRSYKDALEINIHQPKLLMSLGAAYVRQNRLKQAVKAFELAAAETPEEPTPWEQLGACHYRMGQHDESLVAYKKAIALSNRSATAHRGMGVVYMTRYVIDQTQTDSRDQAIAAWHASLEIQPNQQDLLRLVRKYAPKYVGPQL